MATGPVLGYLYQYRLIKLTQQVGSFSIDICGILIFANVLRLNFALFKHFELALIFQSIFMILMQIFLLHLCAKFNPKKIEINMTSQISQNQQSQRDLTLQKQQSKIIEMEMFWRWQKFKPFAIIIILFIVTSFSISSFFKFLQINLYGQLIGLISLISQSLLILPQIIRNIRMGTTKGLSYMLLFLNQIGDILKLVYFLLKGQPFQFILCGIIQICLDSFVIGQIIYYRAKQKEALRQGGNKLTPIKRNRWVHEQYQQQTDQSQFDESSANIKFNPRQLALKISSNKQNIILKKLSKEKYIQNFEEEEFSDGQNETGIEYDTSNKNSSPSLHSQQQQNSQHSSQNDQPQNEQPKKSNQLQHKNPNNTQSQQNQSSPKQDQENIQQIVRETFQKLTNEIEQRI